MPEQPHVVWRTSSLSANGADCVQVAVVNGSDSHKSHAIRLFLVRDSKNPDGGVLTFTPGEWHAFLDGVRDDKFSDLS
ncbi:DUF397 domain-containing protein [Streptosporangium sp. NBC_01755]|uniref:DUF397 domain-containing protein n=1 Tax=unclassified Streptosporangium TaxID=2632669 RepID=UPI002DD9ADA8|nr:MULTISPECIES: DUF397 domain-containing protein [unclassified Streptosporangium]WSA23531.1 DUF397 domain-containing protein [Streptosporangium sp. NBC_01810]WSC98260.1 DUF397 domain-containing protein [Streptosporangium sp. NBC_01755]